MLLGGGGNSSNVESSASCPPWCRLWYTDLTLTQKRNIGAVTMVGEITVVSVPFFVSGVIAYDPVLNAAGTTAKVYKG